MLHLWLSDEVLKANEEGGQSSFTSVLHVGLIPLIHQGDDVVNPPVPESWISNMWLEGHFSGMANRLRQVHE